MNKTHKKLTRLSNDVRRVPESFIPMAALPPESQMTDDLLNLANILAEMMSPRYPYDRLFLPQQILEVLRLGAPYGSLQGLALALKGQSKPFPCALAAHFVPQSDEQTALVFLDDIGTELGSPFITGRFPDLLKKPSADDNPIFGIHNDVCMTPTYHLLAEGIQRGVVNYLSRSRWKRNPVIDKSLDAYLAPVRRIMQLLPEQPFQEALQSGDASRILDLIYSVLISLRNRNHPNASLKPNTIYKYKQDFCEAVGHPEWLYYQSQRGDIYGGSAGTIGGYRRKQMDDLDDLPEALAWDSFQRELCDKLSQQTLQELFLVDFPKGQKEGLSYYPEDLATQHAYLHPAAWNCSHPAEICLALNILLPDPDAPGQPVYEQQITALTIFLSILALGRSSSWLETIRVGQRPHGNEKLNAPFYDPEKACIYYPAIGDKWNTTPTNPQSQVYLPANPFWIIPLPPVLQPLWTRLSKNGDQLFPNAATASQITLKMLNTQLHKRYPNLPRMTEGRIRMAFTTLHQVWGGLDPILAFYISGQMMPAIQVPLVYSAVSTDLLAERYRISSEKVFEHLNTHFEAITGHNMGLGYAPVLPPCPPIWMGSGYTPPLELVHQVMIEGFDQLRLSDSEIEKHNQRLLLLLKGLSLLCGLRISDAAFLKTDQIDLDAEFNERPFAHMVLGQAKSNRFTTAGRILPIPQCLIRPMRSMMATKPNTMAFFFREPPNRQIETSYDEIYTRLGKSGLGVFRYHSGRHLLRTFALHHGLSFEATNAILGHQSAGHDLFNPYRPDDPWQYWQEYLVLANKLAEQIGWDEAEFMR